MGAHGVNWRRPSGSRSTTPSGAKRKGRPPRSLKKLLVDRGGDPAETRIVDREFNGTVAVQAMTKPDRADLKAPHQASTKGNGWAIASQDGARKIRSPARPTLSM